MSRIITSAGPRAYRMSSGRRDFIHGKIRPLHSPRATNAYLKTFPVLIGLIVGAVLMGVS